jgi:hypothetical protein
MAPLDARYTPAAVTRTELLTELCGRKALIAVDKLIVGELEHAHSGGCCPPSVHSLSGDWFPDVSGVLSNTHWYKTIRDALDEALKSQGMGWSRRRKVLSKLFVGERPTEALRTLLAQSSDGIVETIRATYPMREQDAQVLARYCTGAATVAEAEAALIESLRDPKWMMQWFASRQDALSAVPDWLRSPSQSMADRIAGSVLQLTTASEQQERAIARMAELGISVSSLAPIDRDWWIRGQDNMLEALAAGIYARVLRGERPSRVAAEDLDRFAPGFSTCIRVMHSSVWNSVGQKGRKAKPSDWLDALHAMYAPYVDVFRTDSYMAPLVDRQARRYGTHVVAKLLDVGAVIDSSLAQRERGYPT